MRKPILVPVIISNYYENIHNEEILDNLFPINRIPISDKITLSDYEYEISKQKIKLKILEEDINLTNVVLDKAHFYTPEFMEVNEILSIENKDQVFEISALLPETSHPNELYELSTYSDYGFNNGSCKVSEIKSGFFKNNNIKSILTNDGTNWNFCEITLINRKEKMNFRVTRFTFDKVTELNDVIINYYSDFPKGQLNYHRNSKKEFISMEIMEANWNRTVNYLLEKHKNDNMVLYAWKV